MVRMPGVTSVSVLVLLLALCPLDVVGLPEDIQVMVIRKAGTIFSVVDVATGRVTDLFTTDKRVSAMDYDPVNQKIYWCDTVSQCFVQNYDGSNQTHLFDPGNQVMVMQLDEASDWHYLDDSGNIWIKQGEKKFIEKYHAQALSVDEDSRKVAYLDLGGKFHDFNDDMAITMPGKVTTIEYNPSDLMLYFDVDGTPNAEIRAMRLDGTEERTILGDFQQIGYISVYRDVIVFTALKESYYELYAVYTNGTSLKTLQVDLLTNVIKPVLFQAKKLPGTPTADASSVQDMQTVFTWTPKIGCLQTNTGTSMKVTLTPGLEDFSLMVMDPPEGCSRDLGQFRQDIIIPESCVEFKEVEVAVQLTEIKDILGGRFFRHFLFSCSELGPDGKAVELTTDTNPDKTQATASNTSYADGSFSLMVVTSANLNDGSELTSASSVLWSQKDIFLVLRHRLATGSQHRTLIPAECSISSTSHPEKKTIWQSKPDTECKQEMGLIDVWTIQSKRTDVDDVTYTQLFPFDFQIGEEVTITCDARECPYVVEAGQLKGQCLEAFHKYQSCGGTFRSSSPKRRREVASPAGNGSASWDQVATRVVSASFTLI